MITTISVIFFSGRGHTTKIAEAVEKGAASVNGIKTHLISIEGKDIVEGLYKNDQVMELLNESDAIIFGSPTYMGGVASQFKAFADATVGSWINQQWRDKLAAGFTVSAALSGDKLHTLEYMNLFAMQHGMIWVGLGELPGQANGVNRLGGWIGAMALARDEDASVTPNEEDKYTGEILGRRVAILAQQYKSVVNPALS